MGRRVAQDFDLFGSTMPANLGGTPLDTSFSPRQVEQEAVLQHRLLKLRSRQCAPANALLGVATTISSAVCCLRSGPFEMTTAPDSLQPML